MSFEVFCVIKMKDEELVILLLSRLIRLTSPNLNYLIGIGAIILYIDIYFFVIPSTDKVAVTVFCNVSFLYISHACPQTS